MCVCIYRYTEEKVIKYTVKKKRKKKKVKKGKNLDCMSVNNRKEQTEGDMTKYTIRKRKRRKL